MSEMLGCGLVIFVLPSSALAKVEGINFVSDSKSCLALLLVLPGESLSIRLEEVQTQLLEAEFYQKELLQRIEDHKQQVFMCSMCDVCLMWYVCVTLLLIYSSPTYILKRSWM